MTTKIEDVERQIAESIAWESELEAQLEIAQQRTRNLRAQLETLHGLRENLIVPEGQLPPMGNKGYMIRYRFVVNNYEHKERTEKLPISSRSEALIEFWNRTPFSRLARKVEVLSTVPY